MGFIPNSTSWRNLQIDARRYTLENANALGSHAQSTLDRIMNGSPETARWISSLRYPVDSREILDDEGKGVKVPFGKAFLLEAAPNWQGSFHFDPESERTANDYAGQR